MDRRIDINDYNYSLPDERIAKYPLAERDASRLLLYDGGVIGQTVFSSLPDYLPAGTLLVFNNTKVIRARLVFFKESGARIELFCLEPSLPADYERAFSQKKSCRWKCMVGNAKKWKGETLTFPFDNGGQPCRFFAKRIESCDEEPFIEFSWDDEELTFGQLLETLGKIPVPPYLNRESDENDNVRYQTVYSRHEGSVAAPTAGLHFTEGLLSKLHAKGIAAQEITLHVGAGTFLPVKCDDAATHVMHAEHFEVELSALRTILKHAAGVVAVGTTSVRTLESLAVLGYRTIANGSPDPAKTIGQWEAYAIPTGYSGAELLSALAEYMEQNRLEKLHASTQIMIAPGFRFRLVKKIITNFHQPKSTLLLLVAAFIGPAWKNIYRFALENDFRFLSYGDSSLLAP